ncbi:unnamed protein product, partial [Laminaria digitata]
MGSGRGKSSGSGWRRIAKTGSLPLARRGMTPSSTHSRCIAYASSSSSGLILRSGRLRGIGCTLLIWQRSTLAVMPRSAFGMRPGRRLGKGFQVRMACPPRERR